MAAPEVEVVDTVGAGDSFCGAVLASLLADGVTGREALDAVSRNRWDEIVRFGVEAAAITVSRLGADPPWAGELG